MYCLTLNLRHALSMSPPLPNPCWSSQTKVIDDLLIPQPMDTYNFFTYFNSDAFAVGFLETLSGLSL